ncbi:hypothetical protein [Rhizobium sp. NXC24]|uniref:hypothetical protein n=1 Tax=Rhizobium sp. NXC24 TaxID=2048897 RepID=UPI00131A5000|nr:hypothetical protein [Rhizobium sp. NXC24]
MPKPHADLTDNIVPPFAIKPATTREVISAVLSVLPAGWQATALPGRIIMYREHRDYSAGVVIGRS